MRYRSATVRIGTRAHHYLVESDNFITDSEVEEKMLVTAIYDEMAVTDDMDALMEEEGDVTFSDDMTEGEFAEQLLDYDHVRLIDFSVMFTKPLDSVLINVYEVDLRHDIAEEPMRVRFSASCGQDMEVDYIATIDATHPLHEVRDEAWRDCVYQLRRYCKVTGVALICGLFQMMRISEDDYCDMYAERAELVVA